MKAVVLKNYVRRSEVYYNYGDDTVDVWHNFKAIEDVQEISDADLAVLKRAVEYFNRNHPNIGYVLEVVVVAEEAEVKAVISDLLKYEKLASERAEKERAAKEEKSRLSKAELEERKKERTLKKLAKELGVSLEEVRELVKNKS